MKIIFDIIVYTLSAILFLCILFAVIFIPFRLIFGDLDMWGIIIPVILEILILFYFLKNS
jgi:hypothetical protein